VQGSFFPVRCCGVGILYSPRKGETSMSIDNQMGVIVAGGGINVDAWVAMMKNEPKAKVGSPITVENGVQIVPIVKAN